MAGQIGHRELVGAIGRTCAVSGPQRAPAARKCTVRIRTLLAPPARATLLGRPFGRVEREPSDAARATPRGGAKVTWYPCEYRRYSRDDPGELITGSRQGPRMVLKRETSVLASQALATDPFPRFFQEPRETCAQTPLDRDPKCSSAATQIWPTCLMKPHEMTVFDTGPLQCVFWRVL